MRIPALASALLLCSITLVFAGDSRKVVAPPTLPKRTISQPATAPAGEQIALPVELLPDAARAAQPVPNAATKPRLPRITLYIPPGYTVPADGRVNLTVHFHTVAWFAIEEHLRHGLNVPLLVLDLGEGSDTYGRPFRADTQLFTKLLGAVESNLRARAGAPASTHVESVQISSFSAGYGSVREVLKQPENVAKIRRVVLADSLYASWQENAPTSRASDAQMDSFAKFADLAAKGEKTLAITHSSIRTGYASTVDTARWLIDHTKTPVIEVAPIEGEPYALKYRADLGHLHIWGYTGDDAQAHLTHVRHIAEVWKALDEAGEP
ncbi:MAG: hypothetical protein QM770_00375 [Tepidisphaeraceae bacterium]